jgi:diguanylate cyclase (GGDEF)-like protein/PAS domain S-box-containing protein
MRLRTKTIIIFLILSLFPLFTVAGISYKKAEEALKTSLGYSFQQMARETIDKTDRSIYEVYRNIQSWSKLGLMEEVLTGDIDGNISSFLMGLKKEYGYFSSLFALNSAGRVVASSNLELMGKDLREQNIYRNSVGGNPYIEDVHLDAISNSWVVSFAFPIRAKFKDNKIVGVLCAQWKAEELVSLTQSSLSKERTESHGASIFLIRRDGLLISAPGSQGEDLLIRNLLSGGFHSAEQAIQHREGYLVEKDDQDHAFLIGYSYSNGYRDYAGLHWAILVVQDLKTAFAPIQQLNFVILGVGTVITLCVIMLSLFITRRMTTPIVKLSEIAHRVSQGDFNAKADYTAHDEMGSLVETFNLMIQDLKKQRAQLVEKHYVDSIIQNMLNSLIVTDVQGTIKTVNKATLDLLEYNSEEEIIGKPLESVFAEGSPLSGSWRNDLIQKNAITNTEITYQSKNGRRIPVFFSGSMMRDDQGRMQGMICLAQDLTERKQAQEALAEQAIRDPLTGLYNRRYLDQRIGNELVRAARNGQPLAILLCDLDHFKEINDQLGHQVGDEVLKAVSKSIQESTRGIDLVFRWGGDEFIMLLADATREGVLVAADRIRKGISKVSKQANLALDLSIGVAFYPEHGRNVDDLMRLADRALYIAKKGGDKIHIGEEEYRLDEHSVKPVFQPVMDIRSGQIVGYEALSRDPEGKLSVAELFKKYSSIGQLNELKAICFRSQLKVAQEVRLQRVFINVDFNLLSQLESVPKPSGIEVILEISELEALHDVENRLEIAKKWWEQGYKFAIDDFGAGFISLPFIARLVPEYIKVDRSTLLQAVSSSQFRKFMKGLVSALHNYAKQGIIAEGVETEKELRVIQAIGIHIVQGFLFGKPQQIN